MNPEPFLQLDRVIHEKGRLAIMSMLAASPELSFTELRDALEMTDGNLTSHMRTLQETGYVSLAKSYEKNRPLTTCSLTAAGKKAFTGYINLLEQVVQQNRPKCNAFRKRTMGQTRVKRSGPSNDLFSHKRGQLLTG